MGAFESTVLDSPEGTTGADAFVLTYSATTTAGTVTVTMSTPGGPAVNLGTFPMNSPLTINGLGGTDSVRIVGTSGADTITVNSSTALTVNGAALTLTNIETRTLAGAAGGDTYRFDADTALGTWTLDEAGGGTDVVDLALTSTLAVSLNLGLATSQAVNANLSLILGSATHFENAIGGLLGDTITGNTLANRLTGGGGNDTLNGAAGNDTLVGGANDDTYVFGTASATEADIVIEAANQGTDTISFASLTTDLIVNLGSTAAQPVHTNRTLKLNSGGTFENLVGGSGADNLTGNALANRLTGNAGKDTLNGASGNDTLVGGANDDTYVFGTVSAAEADILIEAANQGTDTIFFASATTAVTVNLGSIAVQQVHTNRTLKLNSGGTFENLVGGSGEDSLTGNALVNRLTGGAGNDTLNGAAGNDTLVGGANDDTYVFGTASAAEADILIEAANQGTDTISFASLTTDLTVNLGSTAVQPVHTNRTLKLNSGSTFENATGGSANDVLLGNAMGNQLIGGNGHNILVGNAGADTLISGAGRDILIGGLGLDTLTGGSNQNILIAGRTTSDANVTNLLAMHAEWISANAYANRITNLRAGVGVPAVSLRATINVLNDAGEDDSLTGGTGTDWFFRAVDDLITDLFAGETIDVL